MADEKDFIGYCKPGKYDDQVEIGLSPEHIKRIVAMGASSEKGWCNLRLSKGKDSGKPYMVILQSKSAAASPGGQQKQSNPPPPADDGWGPSKPLNDVTDDLPF